MKRGTKTTHRQESNSSVKGEDLTLRPESRRQRAQQAAAATATRKNVGGRVCVSLPDGDTISPSCRMRRRLEGSNPV
jgi:hypothetical protein